MGQRRLSGGVWTPSYYALDVLGSTVALVDSTSTVTDSYRYDVFGNPLLTTGSTINPFRWIGSLGYYYDEELLEYYLRARTYNPSLARFLSQDPLGFGGGDWNLYRYVLSNPVNGIDPSGRHPLVDLIEDIRPTSTSSPRSWTVGRQAAHCWPLAMRECCLVRGGRRSRHRGLG